MTNKHAWTQVYSVIGEANACEPFLTNMIRALKLMPMLNTPQENERLRCAELVKANKKEYLAFCNAKRSKRI
jgi:hypothetical protein